MAQHLEIRQSQSLVMTQRLQQSIKMLQMPAHELQELVFAEVQANPLLNVAEPDVEGSDSDSPEKMSSSESETLDIDSDAWWGNERESSARGDGWEPSSAHNTATEVIEQRHSEDISLKEHLRAQVGNLLDRAADRLIAQHLIDLLDDAGYLTESTSVIIDQLGTDAKEIDYVLHRMQAAEPTGVFARSLAECLTLQLEEKGLFDDAMASLFSHLDLVATGDAKRLRQATGLDEEALKEKLLLLRTLNPKPGLVYGSDYAQTLIPDVAVKREPGKGWRVELNPDAMPRVLINREYHAELNEKIRGKDERKFVADQFATASWLIKSLDQRATNLLKVATEIVAWQKDFLDKGIMYLKPMRLADIAEKAEVHESTVSRIVANKTMTTPRGGFEMKYFFTTGVGGEDGTAALSSRVVMNAIGQIVAKETSAAILSDDAIVKMLRDKGMDIARRTVVKYRQALGIPSSVERRKALAR